MSTSDRTVPTVDNVQVMMQRGPWETKSHGQLMVTMAMPIQKANGEFFVYDPAELECAPDFSFPGLRLYTVRGIPEDGIGGGEWHRIRVEMVFVLEGAVLWTCEDLAGGTKEFFLDSMTGVWMPPYILHAYQALEPNSGLLVVTNTMFDPNDKLTQDTYQDPEFRQLQAERH